jgi:uncharacterized protein YbjT (DUF2867 family)
MGQACGVLEEVWEAVMKVLLLGATGMIGQGALRECLLAPDVEQVLALVRSPTGQSHLKLRELVHGDLFDLAPIEAELMGLDACLFCLGISSSGLDEAAYSHITHELTFSVAQVLARLNPAMTFIYISAAGADSSERGRIMWARVKGRIENALQRLPFKAVYSFRPGAIQPLHGIQSRTRLYRVLYTLLGPLLPLLRRLAPASITTTEQLGRALLRVAREGAPQPILEMRDITRV